MLNQDQAKDLTPCCQANRLRRVPAAAQSSEVVSKVPDAQVMADLAGALKWVLNRRMRSRMHGGVRGLRWELLTLLDAMPVAK